jgi:Tfp pilus assembly protein PilN
MKDINLMLEEDRSQASASVLSKTAFKVNIKVLIGVLLTIAFIIVTVVAPGAYVNVLNAQSEALKNELVAKKYQDVANVKNQTAAMESAISMKQNVINTVDHQGYSTLLILNVVSKAAPKGCKITSLNYSSNGVHISCTADDSNLQIIEFIANLDRLKILTRTGGTASVSIENTNKGQRTFELDYKFVGKGA